MATSDDTGLEQRYRVERRDGSSEPGGKHDGCIYFVLDLNHDPYAVPALRAYIEAARGEYPFLAKDLERLLGVGETEPPPALGEVSAASGSSSDGG